MLKNFSRILSRMKRDAGFFPVGNSRIPFKIFGNPAIETSRFVKHNKIVIKLFPKTFPQKNIHCTILFSGILTFLGLKKEEGVEESELILTIKKGILSIKFGDMTRAERLLHHALKLAYEESNEEGITYIYDLLANVALDMGQNEKAEKLFINVMQRLINNGYKTTDIKVLHISLKLAKIYQNTNNYEKSEIGYQYCIKHMEEKVRVISEDAENYQDTMKLYITTLDNYARFLVEQNRMREALINFQEAHKLSVQLNGKMNEDTALLLNDLGTVSSLVGDLDSAVSYVEEAVEIAKELTDLENVSIIYTNLGNLYLAKEMYNKAKIACQKGLRHARKDEDNFHIEKAKECLKNIDILLKGSRK